MQLLFFLFSRRTRLIPLDLFSPMPSSPPSPEGDSFLMEPLGETLLESFPQRFFSIWLSLGFGQSQRQSREVRTLLHSAQIQTLQSLSKPPPVLKLCQSSWILLIPASQEILCTIFYSQSKEEALRLAQRVFGKHTPLLGAMFYQSWRMIGSYFLLETGSMWAVAFSLIYRAKVGEQMAELVLMVGQIGSVLTKALFFFWKPLPYAMLPNYELLSCWLMFSIMNCQLFRVTLYAFYERREFSCWVLVYWTVYRIDFFYFSLGSGLGLDFSRTAGAFPTLGLSFLTYSLEFSLPFFLEAFGSSFGYSVFTPISYKKPSILEPTLVSFSATSVTTVLAYALIRILCSVCAAASTGRNCSRILWIISAQDTSLIYDSVQECGSGSWLVTVMRVFPLGTVCSLEFLGPFFCLFDLRCLFSADFCNTALPIAYI